MGQFLFYYQRPEPATWVYLSSFLVLGIFFMFHRLWSIRNLDILLILFLTPGLMLVYEGRKKHAEEISLASVQSPPLNVETGPAETGLVELESSEQGNNVPEKGTSIEQTTIATETGEGVANLQSTEGVDDQPSKESKSLAKADSKGTPWPAKKLEFWGFVWLLSVCTLLLLRMLLDTMMVRRPLLEPNLSSGGLTFIGVSLFLFLMANIITSSPVGERKGGEQIGPGYVLLNMLPAIQTTPEEELENAMLNNAKANGAAPSIALPTVAKVLSLTANLVLTFGIVCIGYWHFGNLKTGIGAAGLFLLLPYTAQMSGLVDHVLPGAMLVLAVLLYRVPWFAGIFLGFAAGLVYYPFFLLPLWLSFYWERGVRRFTFGFLSALIGLTAALVFYGQTDLLSNLRQMYGVFLPATEGLGGVWGLGWYPHFRLPILVAFILFSLSFIFWPAQKNLATLMSCTAAIMTAAQFWHGYGGGLYMAWFLPLVALTVFRPNLDDRIALSVVRPTKRTRKPSDSSGDSQPLAQAG